MVTYYNFTHVDRQWCIAVESMTSTFVVFRKRLFGLIKKPVARFQTIATAELFVIFMNDPLFAFRSQGCTDGTKKYLKTILNVIATDMYDLL